MFRKRLTVIFPGLAMTLAMAAQASADCRTKVALTATAAGASIDASGTAEKRAESARERFKVSMDAAVPDGTTYAVWVTNASGSFLAGTITIALGAGELDLNNANGQTMPVGTTPACSVGSVSVNDTNGPVLQGNF